MVKETLQEKINSLYGSLRVKTRNEFEKYGNELGVVSLGDNATYSVHRYGYYKDISCMKVLVSVGNISQAALIVLEEDGFKAYYRSYSDHSTQYKDYPIFNEHKFVNIDVSQLSLEEGIEELKEAYNWNSEIKNITYWVKNDFVNNLNQTFSDIVAEYALMCKLQTELINYDEYQYNRWFDECISNGVVSIDSHTDIDYNLNNDGEVEDVRVKVSRSSINTKHQTTYSTTKHSYLEGDIKITPIKGGKYEFEWNDSYYRNYQLAGHTTKEGVFTKLQFNQFMKDVWYNNTKKAQRFVEHNEEVLDVLKYDYHLEFEQPIQKGVYVPVDGVLKLKSEKETV